VADGKALEKVITTGRRGKGWVEVVSGLRAGESPVLNPEGLRTGNPVRVANPPQTGAGRHLNEGRT
jgi:multidrug efflux pump subunit AcrA (membrane-fusion protein)